MTTSDMILRINDAIRSGDQLDLETLANQVEDLLIGETERTAWLALIETASEAIEGAFG